MSTKTNPKLVPVASQQRGLYNLTQDLLHTFLPNAEYNKVFFVNDISEQLKLGTDQQMVASVLAGMLSAVIRDANDSFIRVSAKVYGNVVLVHVKKTGQLNISAIEQEVNKMQPMVEKMLGSVSVTSEQINLTTVTFGFPNLPLLD